MSIALAAVLEHCLTHADAKYTFTERIKYQQRAWLRMEAPKQKAVFTQAEIGKIILKLIHAQSDSLLNFEVSYQS